MLVPTKHIFDECRVYPWDVLEWIEEGQTDYIGSLTLRNTNITHLPNNMTVDGWLDLRGTNMVQLPDYLYVGGGLFLGGTNIINIPESVFVGGEIFR